MEHISEETNACKRGVGKDYVEKLEKREREREKGVAHMWHVL